MDRLATQKSSRQECLGAQNGEKGVPVILSSMR
jgi:hypothetical protein